MDDRRPIPGRRPPRETGRNAQYVPALPMIPLKIAMPMNIM